ncbi:response regulator [Pseudolysinimonas sp.]|jgi:hypothetical protein|uniref:response regulator n=1 Tax=Pseudolysinimonas sp. TaxID=2680009 RepID=UPI003784A7CA
MANILGQLSGGPLDGQIVPLDAETLETVDDELVLQWEQGQLIYRKAGAAVNTGENDGPTTVPYRFDTAV